MLIRNVIIVPLFYRIKKIEFSSSRIRPFVTPEPPPQARAGTKTCGSNLHLKNFFKLKIEFHIEKFRFCNIYKE